MLGVVSETELMLGFRSEIVQPGELTSVSISKDSRFAIVSHAPNVSSSLLELQLDWS